MGAGQFWVEAADGTHHYKRQTTCVGGTARLDDRSKRFDNLGGGRRCWFCKQVLSSGQDAVVGYERLKRVSGMEG